MVFMFFLFLFVLLFFFFFFFSSRRRHTRCSRDWSSDVCSSDLHCHYLAGAGEDAAGGDRSGSLLPPNIFTTSLPITKTINSRTITNPTCCIRDRKSVV